MQFQITGAGFAAAFAAQNNGPSIKITEFKIGGGFNYTPQSSDIALHGDTLYVGTPTAYRVIDQNTAEYTLRMDETVGSWQFGEIGLYLQDGTLFAVAALQHKQWKIAYPGTDFNRFKIKVRLVMNGVIPKLELVVQHITAGIIWELPSVDDLPLTDDAPTNVYLCHSRDDMNNEALCTKSADRWTITTHPKRRLVGRVDAVGIGHLDITASELVFNSSVTGKYLIQFTSGLANTAVRRVANIVAGKAVFVTAEPGIAVGDTFELLESHSGGADAEDTAFFFSILGGNQ